MVQAAPGSSTSKECCAVPLLLLFTERKVRYYSMEELSKLIISRRLQTFAICQRPERELFCTVQMLKRRMKTSKERGNPM